MYSSNIYIFSTHPSIMRLMMFYTFANILYLQYIPHLFSHALAFLQYYIINVLLHSYLITQ